MDKDLLFPKNKQIYTTMLSLCILFLFSQYIIKFFMPDYFVMVITNKQLLLIGKFIDNNYWAYLIATTITMFITYYIYTCACCKLKYLNKKQTITVAVVCLVSIPFYSDTQLGLWFSIYSMLFLPAMYKADIRDVFIIGSIHGLSQVLSLSARFLPIDISSINFAQFTLLTVECYAWLCMLWVVQIMIGDITLWEEVAHRFTELKNKLLKK